MLNGRTARARQSVRRLIQSLCPTHDECDMAAPADQKVWFSRLDSDGYELPLGWLFSARSTALVSQSVGRPQDCKSVDDYKGSCLLVHIRMLLAGTANH